MSPFVHACIALPLAALAWGPRAEPIATFAVTVSVASEDGAPVVDDAWVLAQLDFAETMFGDLGVHFGRVATKTLDARFAHLESRADRNALAAELEPSTVHLFIVASLRDVDDRVSLRMGVHWRESQHPDEHFIIMAATARPTTLAHELGHFFGNPHSLVEDNVMSYSRTGGAVFFDEAQIRRIRVSAKEYVRKGELRTL
jgi:hypothetical protein